MFFSWKIGKFFCFFKGPDFGVCFFRQGSRESNRFLLLAKRQSALGGWFLFGDGVCFFFEVNTPNKVCLVLFSCAYFKRSLHKIRTGSFLTAEL